MTRENCPICGKGRLLAKTIEFRATVNDCTGRAREVSVPSVLTLECGDCGEQFLDPSSENAIAAAQRKAMGLLSAEEIKALRDRLHKTQAEISVLLGIGQKTYTRWESGIHFQSESSDRYLRLLIMAPSNAELLSLIARRKAADQLDVSVSPLREQFPFVKDLDSATNLEERFKNALAAGMVLSA
ncbi:MAG: type II TA system antitoxin MqsA family protein [Candidatus Korobacteraceae bacterium]